MPTLPQSTRMHDAQSLIWAVEGLNVAVPQQLSNLCKNYDILTQPAGSQDPARAIVDAAIAGELTEGKIDELCTAAAAQTAVAEYRSTLARKSERLFLKRFHDALNEGEGDAILDGLRPTFDEAADKLRQALDVVDTSATDEALVTSASTKELNAWRSLPDLLHRLNQVAAIAASFGINSSTFPLIDNPRDRDITLKGNTRPLDDRAVMCAANDIHAGTAIFANPHPVGDVRTSPWLRVTPKLHTLDEARERVRAWAEEAWAGLDAVRSKTYSTVNGELVEDTRANPFRINEPV